MASLSAAVGVGWVTHFDRKGLGRLAYKRLRYAYRPPAFFMQEMNNLGASIDLIEFDEELQESDLHGSTARTAALDILFLSSHGSSKGGGYTLALHSRDWDVLASDLGSLGPKVLVADTCNLVTGNQPGWESAWENSNLGVDLRLVLGFSTAATAGRTSTMRGAEFVRELSTRSVADAWLKAAYSAAYAKTDQPVAIALGDDDADANSVFSAKLNSIPGPRSVGRPSVVRKP